MLFVSSNHSSTRTDAEEPTVEVVASSHWCSVRLHNAIATYRHVVHHRYKSLLVKVQMSLGGFDDCQCTPHTYCLQPFG